MYAVAEGALTAAYLEHHLLAAARVQHVQSLCVPLVPHHRGCGWRLRVLGCDVLLSLLPPCLRRLLTLLELLLHRRDLLVHLVTHRAERG
jgi:hypothetical protein